MNGAAMSDPPLVGLYRKLSREAAGEEKPMPLPWTRLNEGLGGGLMPGTITIFIGEPGSSKTFAVLLACLYAHEKGWKWAYLPLERDNAYAERRMLAILKNDWNVLNPEHAGESLEFIKKDGVRKLMARLTVNIQPNPRQMRKDAEGNYFVPECHYGEMMDRMRELCATRDFVILDPLSMLSFDDANRKQWESQEKFAKDLAAIVMQTQTRLLLVHHTRKSAPGMKARQNDLSEAAGSAGITRFADNVLFLEHHHEGIDSEVCGKHGVIRDERHKRVLFIAKARDGKGTGWRIACDLDERGPILIEHGCIRSKSGK